MINGANKTTHILTLLAGLGISGCLVLTLFAVCLPPPVAAQPPIRLAILPYTGFDSTLIPLVAVEIKSLYQNVEISVLPETDLPQDTYYPPRHRYRAEKLLRHLDTTRIGKYEVVVGLTNRDISTTKGVYPDWGIFGLGEVGGRTCVVSTFRLGRGEVPDSLFHKRLTNVINHEIGHVFGLTHCDTPGCLMQDARGKIKTVDDSKNYLCPACRKVLAGKYSD